MSGGHLIRWAGEAADLKEAKRDCAKRHSDDRPPVAAALPVLPNQTARRRKGMMRLHGARRAGESGGL